MNNQNIHYLVTGATGWLGRATLHMLESRLGAAFETRVTAFASKLSSTGLQSGRVVPCLPLSSIRDLPSGTYSFFHCAFLGKELVPDMPLAEYVRLSESLSEQVCDAARRVEVDGFFLPSSGAVYRADRSLERDVAKSPYGALKLLDEERFSRLAEQLNRPLVIARVFNIAGPYINKTRSYALSSILESIREHHPIEIRARQPVIRSYVHVLDLLDLAMACLERGEKQITRFDTAGEIEIEVGDLARLALDVMRYPEGVIVRQPLEPQPGNRYVGDRETMVRLAQAHDIAFRPLADQIRDTADYLKNA